MTAVEHHDPTVTGTTGINRGEPRECGLGRAVLLPAGSAAEIIAKVAAVTASPRRNARPDRRDCRLAGDVCKRRSAARRDLIPLKQMGDPNISGDLRRPRRDRHIHRGRIRIGPASASPPNTPTHQSRGRCSTADHCPWSSAIRASRHFIDRQSVPFPSTGRTAAGLCGAVEPVAEPPPHSRVVPSVTRLATAGRSHFRTPVLSRSRPIVGLLACSARPDRDMQNHPPASSRWGTLPLGWWAHEAMRMAVRTDFLRTSHVAVARRPPMSIASHPHAAFSLILSQHCCLHRTRHTPRIKVLAAPFRNDCGARRTNKGD
jgi:hypothetical protein